MLHKNTRGDDDVLVFVGSIDLIDKISWPKNVGYKTAPT